MIETKDNINSSINKYKNIIIDIDDSIINNLIIRYNKYITININQ
jgi:predicted secreted acid phosphatase